MALKKITSRVMASSEFMVPYHKALEAMAYSGMSFDEAVSHIRTMGFFIPQDGSEDFRALKDNYDIMRKTSSSIDSDYILPEAKIAEMALDPIFSWAQADGNERVCRAAKQINKLMAESRHYGLRRIVDTLIMLGYKPQDIEEAIQRSSKSPTIKWDSNEIAIYRSFFWDTGAMSASDWNRYFEWYDKHNRLTYVLNLIETPVDTLLWEIGVPLNQSLDDAAEDMMRDCYIQFKKSQTAEGVAVKDMTALSRAFKELYGARYTKKTSDSPNIASGESTVEELKQILGLSGATRNPAQHFDITVRGELSTPEPLDVTSVLDSGAIISDSKKISENKMLESRPKDTPDSQERE